MRHRLHWTGRTGFLADALGLDTTIPPCSEIEKIVEEYVASNKNMRQLFEAVGELDISEEVWANFLYTFGFWDGSRGA